MIKDILERNGQVSVNDHEMNILKEHFPACFSKDGSFDIERFKAIISDKLELKSEGYELKFLGKNYARLLASVDTTTVIKPDKAHNEKPENLHSENLYITGDNLDALKHLLKSYAGKIKCIYIDPPYNTGSDSFVYNDRFNFTVDDLMSRLSISEAEAQRILDLTRRGSASHSAWLMFMYPRLQLARDLLADDGVIFISIDDNEQANLKLICDDIFGEENFVADIIWRKKTGASDAKGIAIITESILCYIRQQGNDINQIFEINRESYDINRYSLNDEYSSERGPHYTDNLDRGGLQYSDSMNYPISAPDGKTLYPNGRTVFENDGWTWKWSKQKVEWGLENGFIVIEPSSYKDSGWAVKYKNYLFVDNEGKEYERGAAYKNIILDVINSAGTTEVNNLLGGNYFSNPKPSGLILQLLKYLKIANFDFVLDFFSGSATTADAVMQLNAEDGGERKFIIVQLPELIEEDKPAYKAGYRSIDEIGRERIIRAAKKIKEEKPDTTADLGFKHFVLAEPSGKQLDEIIDFDHKANVVVTNTLLQEFGTDAILATWLVRDGYGFSPELKTVKFGDYTAYYIDKHLYLINELADYSALEAMVTKFDTDPSFNPENIVLFSYSFTWTQLEMIQTNLKRLKATEKNLRLNFDVRY